MSYEDYFNFKLTIEGSYVQSEYRGIGDSEAKKEKAEIKIDPALKEKIDNANNPKNREILENDDLKSLGDYLYGVLFAGQIGKEFDRANKDAGEEGVGIRILLKTDSGNCDTPWELVRYKDKYLATDDRTPFLRIYPGATNEIPLGEKAPKIMSILANVPPDYPVDIANEKKNLQTIFEQDRHLGVYDDVGPADSESIISFLREERKKVVEKGHLNVIHITAHGKFNEDTHKQSIILAPSRNEQDPCEATGEKLKELFQNEKFVGLIVLNACSTGNIQSSAGLVPQLLENVPAVVAMRQPIHQEAAKEFTKKFYSNLISSDITVTMQLARHEILVAPTYNKKTNPIDFSIPVLYMGYNEEKGTIAKRIFVQRRESNPHQLTQDESLRESTEKILTIFSLHDKSKDVQECLSALRETCEKLGMANIKSEKMRPSFERLSKPQLEPFVKTLNKLKSEFCDIFSTDSANSWKEDCESIERKLKIILTFLAFGAGEESEITEICRKFNINYSDLELRFAQIVLDNIEAK